MDGLVQDCVYGEREQSLRILIELFLVTYNMKYPALTHWGRHFPDDIFKCIFLNENVYISIKISLNFVPKGQINNIPALV